MELAQLCVRPQNSIVTLTFGVAAAMHQWLLWEIGGEPGSIVSFGILVRKPTLMPKKLGLITMDNGVEAVFVAEINDGNTHIISDDSCWVLVNGRDGEARWSTHIFSEALMILKDLPNYPHNYEPLQNVDIEKLREEKKSSEIVEG